MKKLLILLLGLMLVLGLSACGEKDEKTDAKTETKTDDEKTEVGTLKNPIPVGDSFTFDLKKEVKEKKVDLEIRMTVQSIIRGEEAWKLIQAENSTNKQAPEGMEYALIKINGELTKSSDPEYEYYFNSQDFYSYDSKGIAMPGKFVVEPDAFGGLVTVGGSKDGMVALLVPINAEFFIKYNTSKPYYFASK